MSAALVGATAVAAQSLSYPVTRKSDQVDVLHGVSVPDPYRWLEDDNSAETKAWVDAQNKVTFGYLETLPKREQIKQRLTELWNYERFGLPFKQGGKYFWSRNDGLQAQDVLNVADKVEGPGRLLIDPNTFEKDGTSSLATYSVSPDGKYVAYAKSGGGSDWREWRIREVDTGKDLPEVIKWSKFSSASWSGDSKGFFYNRYDAPKEGDALKGVNVFPKIFYHRIGTAQDQDVLVHERPDDKELFLGAKASTDGKYLVITLTRGTDRNTEVYWMPLGEGGGYEAGKVTPLVQGFNAIYAYVGNIGSQFYFRTDDSAPRGRVIAIDVNKPDRKHWKEVVPQQQEVIDDDDQANLLDVESVNLLNNQVAVTYLKDARNVVRIFTLEGKAVREVKLPGLGTTKGFLGKPQDGETFFSFTSFTHPTSSYRLDLKTGDVKLVRQPKVAFKPDDFEVKQEFFASKDGTRVPMFIVHKKGLKYDGNNPVWLYGYGGFKIPLQPGFNASRIPWLEMGGVYVMANIRGGGEYGKAWHEAAIKLNRQKAFDDFAAAADWLIANKVTSKGRIAIHGGSNGGLLVGAVMNQRPELFGAAVPEVGVMDMLRFHKFTIGWAWASDFGSAENPDEFKALLAYSPLHNLKAGVKYPATLVMTADHDDRVVPAHSFKYAAQLQASVAGQADAAPALIRISTKTGHGAGKPVQKVIEERADFTAFILKHTAASR
ncbi:MAG: prolyl oligopeptidase family serine peptidase [Burkholderiales bacterium]|nr:prolyl oligopeptidase family serine peptidase [Burkholderiales bacterium]